MIFRLGLNALILAFFFHPAQAEIIVSEVSRAHQPGEVVLFVVTPDRMPESATARVFDRTFEFYPVDEDGNLEALVGVDLDIKAGSYPLEFVLKYPEGQETHTRTLEIQSKEFPTRRLTVDSKFVTPPSEVLDRIRREAQTVRNVLAQRSPKRLWHGEFLRPVPGAATSSFGKRSILNGQPRSPHTGTDFRAGQGTPVQSPNQGKVVLAADLYYSGNVVILDHGLGLFSYFAHLSKISVKEGDLVQKGQEVGLVGSTGRVTGPHLHWTLRLAGCRVDPLSLMEVLQMRVAGASP